MSKNKVLSIIVPAYNVELYLARCLDSVVYSEDILNLLDIIVVNDGSTDNTIKVAKKYQAKYPGCIRIIDKENGGHGSAINIGVKQAIGKYVRVLDADDWFNIIDFKNYVVKLQDADADLICTNYKQDILANNNAIIEYDFKNYKHDKIYDISCVNDTIDKDDFFFQFSIPSMTIKLEALKKEWGDGIMEKTFYVDQCYIVKVLSSAKNFVFWDFDIYRYFVGRPNQSVNYASFFQHRKDHEKVLRWLIQTVKKGPGILNLAFEKQIFLMLETHFGIYINNSLTDSQKNEIKTFYKWLIMQNPEYKNVKASKNLNLMLTPMKKVLRRLQ